MIYIVCYDIRFESTDDKNAVKRLSDISRVLVNYGIRRQRSLFECILDSTLLDQLKADVTSVIDKSRDSVRLYPLCKKCLKNTIIQGTGEIVTVKEFEIT